MSGELIIKCGDKSFVKGQGPIIMGIINVTPDSFSDGKKYFDVNAAIARGVELLAQGAHVLDIGGVSTAPHALLVSAAEEGTRVFPVIEGLAKLGINNISVDTTNGFVAEKSLQLGASWINDQSAGLGDHAMPNAMLKAQGVVLMHSRGLSGVHAGESMDYADIFGDIRNFFAQRITELTRLGLAREKIILDPGIGFGKGLEDSLKIIANMGQFSQQTSWSLIGVSRKSFLGKLSDILHPQDRDWASMGANMAAIISGADIIRTHNVRAACEVFQVFNACMQHKLRSV